MSHLKSDKPQTKLGILNMAVEVIMTLEQQVRGILSYLLSNYFLIMEYTWIFLHFVTIGREKFKSKSCMPKAKRRGES